MGSSADAEYLVIVCLNDTKTDTPDLSTLRAFKAKGNQGINYYPGVWHHPMIALDVPMEFVCIVYEDSTAEDCEEVFYEESECIICS
jgi:ureidoglycolate lyase